MRAFPMARGGDQSSRQLDQVALAGVGPAGELGYFTDTTTFIFELPIILFIFPETKMVNVSVPV
jgi:hypothetical protein